MKLSENGIESLMIQAQAAEDAAFAFADPVIGMIMETGDASRYISDEDLDKALTRLKGVNPRRYSKEIAIYFE